MIKTHKLVIYYWIPVVIFCSLIFIQSSCLSPCKVSYFPHVDKLIHIIIYAILGMLFFRAFQVKKYKDNVKKALIISILSSTLYGISDELHQNYVSFRQGDPMDILADAAGSALGAYSYMLVLNKIKYFKNPVIKK